MKQRKLRSYVLPTVYVIILMLVFGTVSLVSTLLKTNPNYLFSTPIVNDYTVPVINVPGGITEGIIKPFSMEGVVLDKPFYDVNGTPEEQANALIYFEDTYMKNTGVLYKADQEFDCVSVLDGIVLDVREDELLGNVVEVEHSTNLRTIYYSLSSVNVKKGDVISQGEILGVSGTNSISESLNNLLFEVYYNGALINPEAFYQMDVSSLS